MTQYDGIFKDHVNKRMDWTEYFEYLVQKFKSYFVSILTRKKNNEEPEWENSRSNKVHPNASQASLPPLAGAPIPSPPPPPQNRKMSRFDELL